MCVCIVHQISRFIRYLNIVYFIFSFGRNENDVSNDIGKFTYKSKGSYFTRMIVKYTLNHDAERKEIVKKGSGSYVMIPANAQNIVVRFQVMRFPLLWCDVKKWIRKKKSKGEWYKPTVPHTFTF